VRLFPDAWLKVEGKKARSGLYQKSSLPFERKGKEEVGDFSISRGGRDSKPRKEEAFLS